MQTPYFPSLRSRLAALGQRTVQTLRHTSLPQLEQCLGTYLPVHLLSSEDEGTNSRERIYSLRLTFQCFIWQMLKPQTACREVVRQVQALFRLKGWGRVKNGSAYCQARLRLPRERLEKALAQMAQHADQRVGEGGSPARTNHGMGSMTGADLIRILREKNVKIPIIMVSGNPAVREEAAAVGATVFVDKSLSTRLLEEEISRLLPE